MSPAIVDPTAETGSDGEQLSDKIGVEQGWPIENWLEDVASG